MPEPPASSRRRDWVLLGLACFAVYLANARFIGTGDTLPARLLPFSILREGNLDLNEFDWIRPEGFSAYYLREGKGARWWSKYPVLAPLLAAPLAAPAVWWLHARGVPDDSVTFHLTALVVERVAAAAIAAASVCVLFLAAHRVTSPPHALAAALVYAFGTNTWAVSSQALWQHGPAELSLCGLSLCLLGVPGRRNALAAGFWAALGVAARPSMILFAAAALLFIHRERRAWLWHFLAAPALIGTVLVAYNLATAGRLTGGYGTDRLALPSLFRLAGLLVSPNRGLLVYTPAVLLALPAALAQPGRPRSWLRYLAVAAAGYAGFMSCYVAWWAGHCWGPRFLTDLLPAVALLGAAGASRIRGSAVGRVLACLAIGWSVAVQVVGVYLDDRSWSQLPESVDQRPQRVWDWTDVQIVRGLRSGWHGTELAPILWQAFTERENVRLRPLEAGDLSGTITPTTPLPARVRRGDIVPVAVRIENRGGKAWPAFSTLGPDAVSVLQQWECAGRPQGVGGPSPLPRNLGPGRSDVVPIPIESPSTPGRCTLQLTVVQRVGFGAGLPGNAALRVPVDVD